MTIIDKKDNKMKMLLLNNLQKPEIEREKNYSLDITYATNNELGFDYLRDNMAQNKEQLTQGELFYAVVDEVDSILVDDLINQYNISDNERNFIMLRMDGMTMGEITDDLGESAYKISQSLRDKLHGNSSETTIHL